MRHKKIFVPLILILLIISACLLIVGLKKSSSIPASQKIETKDFSIILNQQNSSLASGLAIFQAEGQKTIVKIKVVNASSDTLWKASLNKGNCTNSTDEVFTLSSLKNNESNTILNTSLAELLEKKPLNLRIENNGKTLACGDIASK